MAAVALAAGMAETTLAMALPVLLAWVPLLRRERRPVWFLGPTLAAVAFALWAGAVEGALVGAFGGGPSAVVAASAVATVLLLVVLPLVLLWVFGEGHLIPGPPALGLGRRGLTASLGYGLVAGVVLVPFTWAALSGAGAAPTPPGEAVLVAVGAVAEEVFFRGILLIPLVPLLGRLGAFAVSGSSFVLSRPSSFLALADGRWALLPRPAFALALVATAVALTLVSLRTRHVAGAGLGRILARLGPSLLL